MDALPLRYRIDDLILDVATREVRRGTQPIDLPGLSFDLLLALVEASPGVLNQDEIADRVWGGRLVSPETITQRVKLIRDALGDDSEEPRYIGVIRGHGYRLLAAVEAADDGSGMGLEGRNRFRLVLATLAAVLFIVIGTVLLTGILTGPASEGEISRPVERSGPPSIAVLPFTDLSSNRDQAYFAEAMSENLIHALTQMTGVKVIAKASSFYFRGKDVALEDIAKALDVVYILDGGIQRSGDSIRVTAHLIDSLDQSHVWSRSYDREYVDLFAVQDEIARSVASELRIALQDSPIKGSQPALAAYEQVIRGRHLLHASTAESLEAAERHFKLAIELDPEYVLAYVELANAYDFQSTSADLIRSESIQLRAALLEKALELDPSSAEALTARGFLHLDRQDFDAAERDLLAAIGLNPSYAQTRHFYAHLLRLTGRLPEALTQARLASELDPLSAWVQAELGQTLWDMGRNDEALEVTQRNIRRHPDIYIHYRQLSSYLRGAGQFAESLYWLQEARRRNPIAIHLMRRECAGLLNLADHDGARRCIEKMAEIHPDNTHVLALRVQSAIQRGDWDAAIAAIEAGGVALSSYDITVRTRAHVLVHRGQAGEALEWVSEHYPQLVRSNVSVTASQLDAALMVASIFHATGDEQARDRLFAAIETVLPSLDRLTGLGYGITDVYIHAMRGESQQALTRLRAAVDAGWRGSYRFHLSIWWYLKQDWRLATLHSEPEFHAIMAFLEEDMARQRAEYSRLMDQRFSAQSNP